MRLFLLGFLLGTFYGQNTGPVFQTVTRPLMGPGSSRGLEGSRASVVDKTCDNA